MDEDKNKADNTAETVQEQVKPGAQSALFDQHHNVVNVAEVLANEKVNEIMDRMGMCTCSRCKADVLALALNSLPTKYVTTDAGKQYIQLNSYKRQFETDVVSALIKATLTVKSSPKHDK